MAIIDTLTSLPRHWDRPVVSGRSVPVLKGGVENSTTPFSALFASKMPFSGGEAGFGRSLITTGCSERNRPFSWP